MEESAARISDCADNAVCIVCIERWLLAQIADNISGDACKLKRVYAAIRVKEFYPLPVGGKLMRYDTLAVNTIVANREGEFVRAVFPSVIPEFWIRNVLKFKYDY